MRIIAHVLCMIDDHRLMNEQMDASDAVTELVQTYNQLALRSCEGHNPDLHLCVVTANTYGSDFKMWLSQLNTADRWRLLDRYLVHFPQSAQGDAREEREMPERASPRGRGRESEEEKDKRQLKFFFFRFCLIMVFIFSVLVVAVGVSILESRHLLPNNVVFKSIMDVATELAKILFTLK